MRPATEWAGVLDGGRDAPGERAPARWGRSEGASSRESFGDRVRDGVLIPF